MANATDARIISFDEPMSPAHATRVVPAAHARAEDVAPFGAACSGNLDYGLGSLFRFVREGAAIKLEAAMLYVGS